MFLVSSALVRTNVAPLKCLMSPLNRQNPYVVAAVIFGRVFFNYLVASLRGRLWHNDAPCDGVYVFKSSKMLYLNLRFVPDDLTRNTNRGGAPARRKIKLELP